MKSPRVFSREQSLARAARKARWAAAVYFFSGIVLPPPPKIIYQTSSATITEKTLFSCQQTHHRG